jgi:hypothetical protein
MSNNVKEEFIKQYSDSEYERIVALGRPQRLSLIPDDLKEVAKLLNELIKQGRIFTMDIEYCSLWEAHGVFGVDGDKLVIITPR